MSGNFNRREFVKTSAAASAGAILGLSLEEKALLAQQAKESKKTPVASAKDMPAGKIGNLKISRLICGGNLISGHAHSRDLIYVSSLLKQYFTDDKVMETFRTCEENGINSAVLSSTFANF
ncbi:MAG TPA: twin-arginine translocation signal domain-containing protein [Sedimentisphaerales bacterium]|nr:twin-arginine translocation signal domain-containing protein [Sedimentisphaerales bacterium]